MTFEYVDGNPAGFDARVCANPDGGTMFGLAEYGIAKRFSGWKDRYAVCDGVALLILERHLPGLGAVWVLPKGPGVTAAEQLNELMPQIAAAARDVGAFMIKLEPELRDTPDARAVLERGHCRYAGPLQLNEHTIIADLSGSIDDVFARIPKKRRYDIRRAERDGVTVRELDAAEENLQLMWELYCEVNEDHGIRTRSREYYVNFWRTYLESGHGGLFAAYADGRPVASVFAVTHGHKSIYKDGASVRERPVQGASHLLQWRVIEWAHGRGATEHDLCGTPPSDRIDDKSHPFYGLGVFKRAFGNEVIDYVGSWDLPLNSRRYELLQRYGFAVWLRTAGRLRRDPYFY